MGDKRQIKYVLLLLLTALIWGTAFVAQREGAQNVGPCTFIATRSLLAAIVLRPVIAWRDRRARLSGQPVQAGGKRLWLSGALCGAALFFASVTQQAGVGLTSEAKAGFITALYIVLVPVAGMALGRRVRPVLWAGVALSVAGMYLLCLSGVASVNRGDVLCLICAALFTVHILIIDRVSPSLDGVRLADIQFLVCGAFGAVGMLLFERPAPADLRAAMWPILYAGLLSSGIGYTLQIVSQKHVNPTLASLLMSLESVFAALSGWVMGRTLTGRELLGCALMFGAIVLAQLPGRDTSPRSEE